MEVSGLKAFGLLMSRLLTARLLIVRLLILRLLIVRLLIPGLPAFNRLTAVVLVIEFLIWLILGLGILDTLTLPTIDLLIPILFVFVLPISRFLVPAM